MSRPKKIIAVGDIHIFNGKRFDEHEHVFANFFKVLDEEKPDLVVVAGDVIDSKLRLSPEQIQICREFLIEVADRCPVIMIPGNHDTNLSAKERLDSLTPVTKSLWGEMSNPIHYLKESGLYPLYGITWAVWSCINNQRSPFQDGAKPDGYTMGLYHGVISGAETDDGFKLSGGIDIQEFDKCDQVIAADIHMQQSFRSGEINYTGSLIQVSVTEQPHGSCLVYTDNGSDYDVRVRRIQNDYSTINLNVGDSIQGTPLPTQKVRLKYDSVDVSRTTAGELAKVMKTTLNVKSVEVVPIIKKKTHAAAKIDGKSEISSANLSDYLKEYVLKSAERLGLTDINRDLPRLLEFDNEFSKGEIKEFETGDFSVLSVELDNFLSFAPATYLSYTPKDNRVDLNLEGLVGISGKNRVGKSSVIKAIQFALFNEMPSNASAIKLINKHNRDLPATVTVYFTKAGKFYRIIRTLTPDKKGSKVTTSLLFHEYENGQVINDLTKESRPYTEAEIRKYLGINETFEMLSLFSAQKRQTEFIDCKNAERLKLVNKFLGLQNFELKEENVKKKITETNAVYNLLSKQFDKSVNLLSLERDLTTRQSVLKMCYSDKTDIERDLAELEFDYEDINSLYTSNLKTANKRIDEPVLLRETIRKHEETIESLRKLIERNLWDAEAEEADAARYAEQFEHLYGHHPADHVFDFQAITAEKQKAAVIEYEIKLLEKQLNMDTCGGCGRDFTAKDKKKVEVQLSSKRHELNQTNAIAEHEEARYQQAKKMIKDIETCLDRADDYREKENARLEGQIKDLTLSIKNAQSGISEYDKVQEAITIIEMLKEKVEEYNLQKTRLQTALAETQSSITGAEQRIKELEKQIKEYKLKINQLEEVEYELNLLKAYRKVVNKDGLPLYILTSKIDEINEKVNLIVSQVFPFNVEFSVDDEKGELRIQFAYEEDSDKNDVGLASGSETFVINLCIKVALSQISSLPKIDTVFIDEGYDSLDKDTIERIPQLFNILTNYYRNVITISHLDEVKDMCMHQIRLERKGKYTEIV